MLKGLVLVILCYVEASHGNQNALFNKLFEDYHAEIRPMCDLNVPIEVKVGIAVRQVIELDEPQQILTVNVWIRMMWHDCQLKWNASEYGGIDSLILPFEQIWTPDITLYDNAEEELGGRRDYRPVVYSDGTVTYNFPTVIESLCLVDVTFFPFDTQRCPLQFGSWASHGLQLNITRLGNDGDISSYKANSEWDLIGVPAVRNVKKYSCCPEPYPDVTFFITIHRKPMFYIFNLLFPCILISAVALLGFLLPPDSGEKVSLELTVLLALSVFMLVVSDTLPPTSETFPLIGIYFFLAMAMVTVSTVLSVIVVNIHFRGQLGHDVPRWVRKLFLGKIARFLCVQEDESVYPVQMVISGELKQTDVSQQAYVNGVYKTSLNDLNHRGPQDKQEKKSQSEQESSPFTSVLQEQLSILKKFDNNCTEKEKNDKMENEWKTLAVVLDRLFLLIFLISMVSITVDEPQQIIKVNLWLRLRWSDCQLTWNPTDYGGIETLIVPFTKIWTPDLTLYDNADDGLPGMRDFRPSIKYDGTVSYNFPTLINSMCQIDVTAFPFDNQRCPLPFGSWAYHGLQINLTSLSATGDLSSFKSNSEWDLVEIPAERHVLYYDCCPEPYPDVTFYVTLHRKPMFYVFNLLLPCILISAVALLGFLLPPDSGEKVSLELTVLLALSVFLFVASDSLPPTSDSFPIIGIYFGISMIMSTLSTLLSVVVINVHLRGQLGHKVPRWVRHLFLGKLATLLRVRQDFSIHQINSPEETNVIAYTYKPMIDMNTSGHPRLDRQGEGISLVNPLPDNNKHLSRIEDVFVEQLSIMRRYDEKMDEKHEASEMEDEWKIVATVMDRLFGAIVFVLLVVCTLVTIIAAVFRH